MFFRPNVDAIVADVQKKVDLLKAAAQHFAEESVDLEEKAAEFLAESKYARDEAGRALRLAKKFSELVNG